MLRRRSRRLAPHGPSAKPVRRMPLRRSAPSAGLAALRARPAAQSGPEHHSPRRRGARRLGRQPDAASADPVRFRLFGGDGAVPAVRSGTRRAAHHRLRRRRLRQMGRDGCIPALALVLAVSTRAGPVARVRSRCAGAVRPLPVRLAGRSAGLPAADAVYAGQGRGGPERRRQQPFLAGAAPAMPFRTGRSGGRLHGRHELIGRTRMPHCGSRGTCCTGCAPSVPTCVSWWSGGGRGGACVAAPCGWASP